MSDPEHVSFDDDKSLPLWTWWLPFLLIAFAKVIAHRYLLVDHFYFIIYLPYVVAVPLYIWWGPRVFAGHFLAEFATAGMMGIDGLALMSLYAFGSAAKGLMGYLFFRQMCWRIPLASLKGFGYFFFWTLIMQNLLGNLFFISVYLGAGGLNLEAFGRMYMIGTLKDILAGAFICYPILILFSASLRERGWARKTVQTTES